MKLRKFQAHHFRNLNDIDIELSPNLNFFVGKNGQGKTSVLEGISYLSTLKSFKGAKVNDLIQIHKNYLELNGTLDTELASNFKIRFDFQNNKIKKTHQINGKNFHQSLKYLSQRFGDIELGFHTIAFNPSDHELIRGEPTQRRSFLDQVLISEDVRYLRSLQNYQKVLQQRNTLLKAHGKGYSNFGQRKSVLMGFTEPLVAHAVYIAYRRLNYLYRVREKLNYALRKISVQQPEICLFYGSNWVPEISGLSITNNSLAETLAERHFALQDPLPSLETLEQAFWKKLSLVEEHEWIVGHSLVGPHRDDWGMFLGKLPLKGHGSQGEIRSSLLALKLTEMDLFQTATHHEPILLLDDFSSELDSDRRTFLMQFLLETNLQVFVTTTEETFSQQSLLGTKELRGKIFLLEAGTINEKSIRDRDITSERRKDIDPSF